MPTRPFNTLTLEEVLVLLNTPAFYQFLEIAYDMYQLWQVMVLITTGQFAMPNDPPGPAIDSGIGWPAAAPIADFGAPNVLASTGPISGNHVAAQAPAIPQQAAEEGNAMYWAQLSGSSAMNPGADRVALFENEPAPMRPGINVRQGQTAALELRLADLGNNSGINDYSAAMDSDTAQEPGAVQHPSYSLLSPAQTQTQPGSSSPVSDSDSDVSMGESSRSVVSVLLSPSLSDLVTTYEDLPSEHEESDSDEDLDGESSRSVVSGLLSPSLSDLVATYGDLPSEHEESSSSSDEDLEFSDN